MKKTINPGIYLIIDPAADRACTTATVKELSGEPVAAVQIWDHFGEEGVSLDFIREILGICHAAQIPVLINNRWELLKETALDGVHFDTPADCADAISHSISCDCIRGITCSNDPSVIAWAEAHGFDYISFCSLFPSATANSCELVSFDTIKTARTITAMPIFLAGGIRPDHLPLFHQLDYTGIAIVSGIMNAASPLEAFRAYRQHLQIQTHENRNH